MKKLDFYYSVLKEDKITDITGGKVNLLIIIHWHYNFKLDFSAVLIRSQEFGNHWKMFWLFICVAFKYSSHLNHQSLILQVLYMANATK